MDKEQAERVKKMGEVGARTRVHVTIEFDGSGPYGGDWNLADLVDQSRRESIQNLKQKLARENVTIIGEPEVICIAYPKVK